MTSGTNYYNDNSLDFSKTSINEKSYMDSHMIGSFKPLNLEGSLNNNCLNPFQRSVEKANLPSLGCSPRFQV
jgi:hypothetical protein